MTMIMTFKVASMIMNSMEEAKEVHTCLRQEDSLVPQLSKKKVDGGDLDGRVCTAYVNQVQKVELCCFSMKSSLHIHTFLTLKSSSQM